MIITNSNKPVINNIADEEIIRNMEVKCPECGKIQNVSESVPDTVADTAEYSCISCEHEFLIGWYGVAEVR